MEYDRDLRRRVFYLLVGVVIFGVLALVLLKFLASLTFAIFLYYSTRPIYRWIERHDRFSIPEQIRAGMTLVVFALPFLILIGYTMILIVTEIESLASQYDIQSSILQSEIFKNLSQINELESFTFSEILENPDRIRQLLSSSEIQSIAQEIFSQTLGIVGWVTSVLIRVFIILIFTYYMLTDGENLKDWFLDNFDKTGVLKNYAAVVDRELSSILFGNILNLFITAIFAIIIYYTYNFFAPNAAEVPFPALAGSLTGAGSLVPLIGMKVVYFPIGGIIAVNAFVSGGSSLLIYAAVFMGVTFVFVEFIPDIIIRPFVSGKSTHMGLLMISYLLGPIFFGFYGVFLGPILLVLFINFNRVILPYIITGQGPDQRQMKGYFEDFEEDEKQNKEDTEGSNEDDTEGSDNEGEESGKEDTSEEGSEEDDGLI